MGDGAPTIAAFEASRCNFYGDIIFMVVDY